MTTLALSAIDSVGSEVDRIRDGEDLPIGMYVLVIRHGPGAGTSYRLGEETTTIGRHPDSDLFLDDITVSRRHAILERSASGHVVRDVGSLNGTYLNRHRVEEASLAHGDEVQVGRYRLVYLSGSG